ncbi:hypothetical protein J3459_017303 [Metarhizium acridum]|nr:hypothetical protein J3459_017303 [Metarhizium acridum]
MAADVCQLDEHGEHFTNRLHKGTQRNENRSNNLDDAERKRKLVDAPSAEELPSSKRARLDPDDQKAPGSPQSIRQNMASRLPAEAWHHVFTFVPPRTLGSLMLVNKQFNSYLDPWSGFKSTHVFGTSSTRSLPKLGPDAIWQASRRLFWPRMPAALKGRSELEMWRLCCSRACQFCRFRDVSATNNSEGQWSRGPGAKGVSPVFPFFIVSCGRCLSAKSTTEIDLLLNSSAPSALLPGLPMVFLTQENHVVPPHVLASTTSLSHAQPTKVFWNEQIENIKSAFEDAKGFGPAAAEEWIKGLGSQGRRCLADVARWERWHIAGGVDEMRRLNPRVCLTVGRSPDSGRLTRTANKSVELKPAKAVTNVGHREDFSKSAPIQSAEATSTKGMTVSDSKLKPTSEGAETLKAARRGEIERRAYILQQPILPNVLAHMPAFQAALQSTTPLDDNAWQILRPYLLLQRKEAEIKEREIQVNSQSSGGVVTTADVHGPRGGARVTDADWDRAQGPLRGQISEFADEFIQNEWSGHTVTKKSAPQFAADILLYVRKKFYAKIANDVKADKASGKRLITEPPEGPWTQKLTLENMRWIFDVKIKPYTDRVRKEVFRCNGCEGSSKFYEFSGVLQHYASKHTNALSLGNTVVHWRAEWPEKPIFKTDPQHSAKSHAKTKTGPLDDYFLRMPGLPQPVKARLGLEYKGYTSDLRMSLSTNHGIDVQSAASRRESYQREDSCERGHPLYPHRSQSERPPQRPEPSLESSCKMMGESQNMDYGQSSRDTERGKSVKAPTPNSKYLEYIVMVAKRTWRKLANVKRLQDSVRVCAVIHHIAKSFQTKYSEAAPLKLFIKALESHKSITHLGSVSGLSCKACKLNTHSTPLSKTYTLAKLSRHFDGTHSNQVVPSINKPLDWPVDMIWLPEVSTLTNLRSVIGDDKEVLDLVSDALPWAFETFGCGHGTVRNDNSYDAGSRAANTEWQQPSALAEETSRCSNEHSAVPRLELDGFEIIERPAAWSGRHDRIHDESDTRPPQHGIPPLTPPRHIEYRENVVNYQGYTKPAQTESAMSSRFNTHWGNGYENDNIHARRQAHHVPHPRYESHVVESYEIVEVCDPHGSYLIRRTVRPPSQRELYYEDRPQPYAVPDGLQHQHMHNNSSGRGHTMNNHPRISDYEEYDPRFPAASWRG